MEYESENDDNAADEQHYDKEKEIGLIDQSIETSEDEDIEEIKIKKKKKAKKAKIDYEAIVKEKIEKINEEFANMKVEQECEYKLALVDYSSIAVGELNMYPEIGAKHSMRNCVDGSLLSYHLGYCDIRPNVIYTIVNAFVNNDNNNLRNIRVVMGAIANFFSMTQMNTLSIKAKDSKAVLKTSDFTCRIGNEKYKSSLNNASYEEIAKTIKKTCNELKISPALLMKAQAFIKYSWEHYKMMDSYSNLIDKVDYKSAIEKITDYMFYLGGSVLSNAKFPESKAMKLRFVLATLGSISSNKSVADLKSATNVKSDLNTMSRNKSGFAGLVERVVRSVKAVVYEINVSALKIFVDFLMEKLNFVSADGKRNEDIIVHCVSELYKVVKVTCMYLFNICASVERPIEIHYLSPEDIFLALHGIDSISVDMTSRMQSLKMTGLTFDRVSSHTCDYWEIDKIKGEIKYSYKNKLYSRDNTNVNRNQRKYVDKKTYVKAEIGLDELIATLVKDRTKGTKPMNTIDEEIAAIELKMLESIKKVHSFDPDKMEFVC